MLKKMWRLALSEVKDFTQMRVNSLMLGDVDLLIRIGKLLKIYNSIEEAKKEVNVLKVSCLPISVRSV